MGAKTNFNPSSYNSNILFTIHRSHQTTNSPQNKQTNKKKTKKETNKKTKNQQQQQQQKTHTHKISPDTNSHISKHTQMSNTKFSKN